MRRTFKYPILLFMSLVLLGFLFYSPGLVQAHKGWTSGDSYVYSFRSSAFDNTGSQLHAENGTIHREISSIITWQDRKVYNVSYLKCRTHNDNQPFPNHTGYGFHDFTTFDELLLVTLDTGTRDPWNTYYIRDPPFSDYTAGILTTHETKISNSSVNPEYWTRESQSFSYSIEEETITTPGGTFHCWKILPSYEKEGFYHYYHEYIDSFDRLQFSENKLWVNGFNSTHTKWEVWSNSSGRITNSSLFHRISNSTTYIDRSRNILIKRWSISYYNNGLLSSSDEMELIKIHLSNVSLTPYPEIIIHLVIFATLGVFFRNRRVRVH
ncbi:MAG: hypothetical protein ACFFB2_19450 [Promethearchaeota archaeon]